MISMMAMLILMLNDDNDDNADGDDYVCDYDYDYINDEYYY
jgi:hypothetical protein